MKADQKVPVPTLVLTGTAGAGKSTVAAEINDALAGLKIPNAAVDLDALVWQWPSTSMWNNDLIFENLASLWPNYQAPGATHLILARVLDHAPQVHEAAPMTEPRKAKTGETMDDDFWQRAKEKANAGLDPSRLRRRVGRPSLGEEPAELTAVRLPPEVRRALADQPPNRESSDDYFRSLLVSCPIDPPPNIV